ncbi:hypothetical protein K488DRAFT_70539 [Vararia minispora EC-137]|uniref:Uncharacterized protein n=1 Tax=Vararia minispora EC-137 TaxID=1314806 RepID=A0ACB8QLL2_9AGAM|nr:hypothetical protein K488DRAFT_70539 [Vararia minispora EC-137]
MRWPVGAFIIEVVVWGFPNAYDALHFLSDLRIESQPHVSSALPSVGVLYSGITYHSGPFLNVPVHLFLISSEHLRLLLLQRLATIQGAMYAVGASLAYAPTVPYMSEWFMQKRGLADGVLRVPTTEVYFYSPSSTPLVDTRGPAPILCISRSLSSFLSCSFFSSSNLAFCRVHVHGPGRCSGNKIWLKDWRLLSLVVVKAIQGLACFAPIKAVWLLSMRHFSTPERG